MTETNISIQEPYKTKHKQQACGEYGEARHVECVILVYNGLFATSNCRQFVDTLDSSICFVGIEVPYDAQLQLIQYVLSTPQSATGG